MPAKNGFRHLRKTKGEDRDKIAINRRASNPCLLEENWRVVGGKIQKDLRISEEEKFTPTKIEKCHKR